MAMLNLATTQPDADKISMNHSLLVRPYGDFLDLMVQSEERDVPRLLLIRYRKPAEVNAQRILDHSVKLAFVTTKRPKLD